MQKEVILAILVGFIIGLLITFGIWKANQAIISTSSISPQPNQTENPTPELSKTKLDISSPVSDFLTKESNVVIKGTYRPNAEMVIISEKDQKTFKSDNEGNFEVEVNLILGENQIQVYGFTKEGEEDKQVINVVYSTAEI